MAITIKVSQKHIERLAFSLIILALLGLLMMEKYDMHGTATEDITGYQVADLLPSSNDITNVEETTTSSTTSTTINVTTTSTTTTTLPEDILFSVSDLEYTKIDDEKATIDSVKIKVQNGLDSDYDLTIKYYIYDDESSTAERMNSKRPFLEIGVVESGAIAEKTFELHKYVFRLDLEKTIKFYLVTEDGKVSKTVIKKIKVQ